MTIAASAALRAAVHDALASDAALTSLLGGAKVYDEPPRSAAFPYVTMGETRITDFSSGDERGEEHQLMLHAWSRQGGHKEAHLIAGATGKVSFPAQGMREVLSADRTYYVRADGDDANDGLADTAGGAFATLQHAADVVFGTLDLGGHNVTVQVADGSYSEGAHVIGAQVGAGRIYFVGNATTPGNVIVSSATDYAFAAEAGAFFSVQGMELSSTLRGCLWATKGGKIYFSNVRIGTTVQHQMRADDQGLIYAEGNYAIVGGSVSRTGTRSAAA